MLPVIALAALAHEGRFLVLDPRAVELVDCADRRAAMAVEVCGLVPVRKPFQIIEGPALDLLVDDHGLGLEEFPVRRRVAQLHALPTPAPWQSIPEEAQREIAVAIYF